MIIIKIIITVWDFNIKTDHAIQHRRPDIIVLCKRKVPLIDIAVPGDKKDWVERTGKDRQLHRIKTGSEKDLELVSSCGCFNCNWGPRSDIKKIERLGGEVKHKEQHRTFAKSSIAWNCKNCQTSPRDLRLLGATCSLGNIPELPTKQRETQ